MVPTAVAVTTVPAKAAKQQALHDEFYKWMDRLLKIVGETSAFNSAETLEMIHASDGGWGPLWQRFLAGEDITEVAKDYVVIDPRDEAKIES